MEERVPTTTRGSDDGLSYPEARLPTQYDQIFNTRPPHSRDGSFQDPSMPERETYIVQIPKEQIFSVPPPEHAIIAERYRNPERQKSSVCRRVLCIFMISIVLALVIGMLVSISRVVFGPQVPVFSILRVNAKNSTSSSHKRTNLRYDITFRATNPNGKMGISYDENADAALFYKNHKIGAGKFPELDQEADSSTNFKLGLIGSTGVLPREIKTSILDKKGKQHVSLSLTMDVPVKMKVGALTLWSKVVSVACECKVKSLGAGKDVLSQNCDAKFN